jgi:hypothetical protein
MRTRPQPVTAFLVEKVWGGAVIRRDSEEEPRTPVTQFTEKSPGLMHRTLEVSRW